VLPVDWHDECKTKKGDDQQTKEFESSEIQEDFSVTEDYDVKDTDSDTDKNDGTTNSEYKHVAIYCILAAMAIALFIVFCVLFLMSNKNKGYVHF
jgi:hypothetical protein